VIIALKIQRLITETQEAALETIFGGLIMRSLLQYMGNKLSSQIRIYFETCDRIAIVVGGVNKPRFLQEHII
jgi:hypothetical protein